MERAGSIEQILRVEGGRVVATLTRLTGSIDRAEDALAEAVVVAVERWPLDGIPERPGAWLTTVARRKALDTLRREARRTAKEEAAVAALEHGEPDPLAYNTVRDDQLRLIFTCCHPALASEARVALALRLLCGLTTAEIARAFLVPEPTVGQRISRAKAKIAAARIPYRPPADHLLPERLSSVLAVIYVVFTTGHHAPLGDRLVRVDLAEEAIRLARLLRDLMPDEPECAGLLALVLSVHARWATRLDDAGALVLLADADRSRWDHDAIAEAVALTQQALRAGRPGPYQVQAAISCLHGVAPDIGRTDWPQIVQLYGVLEQLQPGLPVRVNRAVAIGEVEGPAAALALLDGEPDQERAARWSLYHSARADLLRRLDRIDEAAAAYRAALACGPNDVDRQFLVGRLGELGR